MQAHGIPPDVVKHSRFVEQRIADAELTGIVSQCAVLTAHLNQIVGNLTAVL
jgi:hypothetical protein